MHVKQKNDKNRSSFSDAIAKKKQILGEHVRELEMLSKDSYSKCLWFRNMHPMELLQLALVATATQHGMLEQHK
jgi:hypothetical protein